MTLSEGLCCMRDSCVSRYGATRASWHCESVFHDDFSVFHVGWPWVRREAQTLDLFVQISWTLLFGRNVETIKYGKTFKYNVSAFQFQRQPLSSRPTLCFLWTRQTLNVHYLNTRVQRDLALHEPVKKLYNVCVWTWDRTARSENSVIELIMVMMLTFKYIYVFGEKHLGACIHIWSFVFRRACQRFMLSVQTFPIIHVYVKLTFNSKLEI